MKKIMSILASAVLTVSSLSVISASAVESNELSITKTPVTADTFADDGTVIPAGAVAINVNITNNSGFDSSMIKIELGDNYDIINNINENPALSVGSAMGESRVAVSGNDTIAVVSASASETSADGLLFTVFAYENATSDDDINVVDSEFSVCTEEDLVSPLATRAAKKSYTIGDVDEDGYINSADASRVLRAISIHKDSCDRNCKNKEILPVKEAKDNMLFYFPNTTFGPEAADVFKSGKIRKECADDILGYYSCISSGKNYSDYYLGNVGETVIVD